MNIILKLFSSNIINVLSFSQTCVIPQDMIFQIFMYREYLSAGIISQKDWKCWIPKMSHVLYKSICGRYNGIFLVIH